MLKFKENYVGKQKINASKERIDITDTETGHLAVPNRYPAGKKCINIFVNVSIINLF